MKKLLLSILFSVLYVTSASAEIGVNVGASGNVGLFAAGATETVGGTGGRKANGTEHGSAGWGSLFIEKTLGSVLVLGVDYTPGSLSTDTTETAKSDMLGSTATPVVNNKVQIDFEDLTTYYVSARMGENFYAKAGLTSVSVVTNESLATGSTYGNVDLDGMTYGLGFNHTTDSGAFVRVEGNYVSFDSASVTSSANSNVIKLSSLDGVSGKISIGKSF